MFDPRSAAQAAANAALWLSGTDNERSGFPFMGSVNCKANALLTLNKCELLGIVCEAADRTAARPVALLVPSREW